MRAVRRGVFGGEEEEEEEEEEEGFVDGVVGMVWLLRVDAGGLVLGVEQGVLVLVLVNVGKGGARV